MKPENQRDKMTAETYSSYQQTRDTIVQFAITINRHVCPHIRVLNMLMRESYA